MSKVYRTFGCECSVDRRPHASAFLTPETGDSHGPNIAVSYFVPMNDTIFYRFRDLEFGVDKARRG